MYEPMCMLSDGGWRRAADGEWSDALVVTNLLNTAMPLLRYAVEDRVAIDRAGPGGPWTGRQIRLGNRRFAPLQYGGVAVDAGALLQTVSDGADVLDAALVQTARGVRVEAWFGDSQPDGDRVAAFRRRAARALEAAGLDDPEVTVEVVEHPAALPRTPAGKRRAIVTA